MDKVFFTLACVLGLAGVALGAFGAHALKGQLAADLLPVYETGVRYLLLHALALLAVAWACTRWPGPLTTSGGVLLATGIGLFSGSLVLMALTGVRSLGIITPVGGILLLAGWGCLAAAPWRPASPASGRTR